MICDALVKLLAGDCRRLHAGGLKERAKLARGPRVFPASPRGASAPHPGAQRDNGTDAGRTPSVHLAERIEEPFLAHLPLTPRPETTLWRVFVSVFTSYGRFS